MKRQRKKALFLGMVLLAALTASLLGRENIAAAFTKGDRVVRYFTIQMDKQAPVLTVITPAGLTAEDPTYAVTTQYAVTGSVSDESIIRRVTVNGNVAEVQKGGSWTYEISLQDGVTQKIEVVAVDSFGNASQEIRYVRYDSSVNFEEFVVTRWNRAKIGYTTELTELIIPETFYDAENNTWYHVVGIGFEEGANKSLNYAPFSDLTHLTSVTIPGSVKYIHRYSFYGNTGLETLRLGHGIQSIDMAVFHGCTALKEILLPDSITELGSNAFYGCEGATKVTLSEGLTVLYSYVFGACYNLTGCVVIPDSVTVLYTGAFVSTDITSVVIPVSVIEIQKDVFRSCNELTQVYYKGTEEQWAQISFGKNNTAVTGANIIFNYRGGS